MASGRPLYVDGYAHNGEPIMLTEFGGLAYVSDGGWGYTTVKTDAEYLSELARIFKILKKSEVIHGYCYTQLTDVEQEKNGLLNYDRTPKVSLKVLRNIVLNGEC